MSTLEDRKRIVRRATFQHRVRIAVIGLLICAMTVLVSEVFMEFGIASRLWWSSAEMVERHADKLMMGHVAITRFAVACPIPGISDADLQRFNAYADARNWTQYPQGGANCRDP